MLTEKACACVCKSGVDLTSPCLLHGKLNVVTPKTLFIPVRGAEKETIAITSKLGG